ncbi:MAG TPA: HAMP domain-containing histidine kinase [Desulfobacteraceae bacterium]|nr:HAMP domain-containing histidine kinase [Desulfobacteraceae bacterium]
MTWSMAPVWIIDIAGSFGMIVVSTICLGTTRKIIRKAPENALANYMLWFTVALFAFSVSRSAGHILKHLLYFSGHYDVWRQISPVSGSINTITFVIIGSVTLYFGRMETIMNRMARDREKISSFNRELLELNRDIESIVSERTRVEMALRFAHDIRNPSMIIGGLVRRMKKNFPESSPELKKINQIQEQVEKLESLVAKLDLSEKKGRWTFSALELSALTEEALAAVQDEAASKGIILFLDRAPSPLTFQGNRHLVKIALMHLLRNAIEACGNGDTIEVATEAGEKSVTVRIEDNGPGIPAEMVKHIFEPYFSTGEGTTGIGLPYVKQIIEDHNGTIQLTSSRERGTSVVIVFPPLLGELSRTSWNRQPLPCSIHSQAEISPCFAITVGLSIMTRPSISTCCFHR